MKAIVAPYISRKWWYRWIRSFNWFAFKYYWFIWLLFLVSVLLLLWLILKPIEQQGCNTEVIENSIVSINERLAHCCDCSNQEPPITVNPPVSPPNTRDCDDQGMKDGGNNAVPPPQNYEVGNQSGTIELCYDNGGVYPDDIIVKHKGIIIKRTGQVIGENCINVPYVYQPGDPTYIEVTVQPSSDVNTTWFYTIGCPR